MMVHSWVIMPSIQKRPLYMEKNKRKKDEMNDETWKSFVICNWSFVIKNPQTLAEKIKSLLDGRQKITREQKVQFEGMIVLRSQQAMDIRKKTSNKQKTVKNTLIGLMWIMDYQCTRECFEYEIMYSGYNSRLKHWVTRRKKTCFKMSQYISIRLFSNSAVHVEENMNRKTELLRQIVKKKYKTFKSWERKSKIWKQVKVFKKKIDIRWTD